jgi:hypothetical protein
MAHPLLFHTASSSSIAAYKYFKIGDEIDNHWSLFVEFKGGKFYRYLVPLEICQKMDDAQSKGQFVNQMKLTYFGNLMSADSVTELLSKVTGREPKKVRKKPWERIDFLAQYPTLRYFF